MERQNQTDKKHMQNVIVTVFVIFPSEFLYFTARGTISNNDDTSFYASIDKRSKGCVENQLSHGR